MLPGMTFTIEPILCLGNPKFKILNDEWTAVTKDNSRTAQFEHTILISSDGAEILTLPGLLKSSDAEKKEEKTAIAKWTNLWNVCVAVIVN